jgi:hypothetical protein
MPKVNLSGMNVEALMDLRVRVDEMLVEHRAQLEKQLERMGRVAEQQKQRRRHQHVAARGARAAAGDAGDRIPQ